MEGNIVKVGDNAAPVVEPPPDVTLTLTLNGQKRTVKVKAGGATAISFGTIPVHVSVDKVERKKNRPASGPPYYWIIKTESIVSRIRAMTEDDAKRIFHSRTGGVGENILEIYPETN